MKTRIVTFLLFILVGCSSGKSPEYIKANDDPLVYMSTAKPPASCKLIGYTSGPYQTFTTGNMNKGKNLHQVHITKTKGMGGNYLEKDHNSNTGKVYSCPMSELLKMGSQAK